MSQPGAARVNDSSTAPTVQFCLDFPGQFPGQGLTGPGAFVKNSKFGRGAVAQLEEHLNGIQGVRGSNPLSSTNYYKGLAMRR